MVMDMAAAKVATVVMVLVTKARVAKVATVVKVPTRRAVAMVMVAMVAAMVVAAAMVGAEQSPGSLVMIMCLGRKTRGAWVMSGCIDCPIL